MSASRRSRDHPVLEAILREAIENMTSRFVICLLKIFIFNICCQLLYTILLYFISFQMFRYFLGINSKVRVTSCQQLRTQVRNVCGNI